VISGCGPASGGQDLGHGNSFPAIGGNTWMFFRPHLPRPTEYSEPTIHPLPTTSGRRRATHGARSPCFKARIAGNLPANTSPILRQTFGGLRPRFAQLTPTAVRVRVPRAPGTPTNCGQPGAPRDTTKPYVNGRESSPGIRVCFYFLAPVCCWSGGKRLAASHLTPYDTAHPGSRRCPARFWFPYRAPGLARVPLE